MSENISHFRLKKNLSMPTRTRNTRKSSHSKLSINSYIMNKKNNIINSFIFMGCWNHIDCSNNAAINLPIFRNIVINEINKEYEKLIILAGDNWYSQTHVENEYVYKYYPLHVLRSGYELLLNNKKKIL